MKVCDLVKMLNLTVFCGEEGLDTEITGGYTSDLLSDVMGHIEEGMLWLPCKRIRIYWPWLL